MQKFHIEGIVNLMPSVYDLKPRFQRLLRPAIGRLAGAGVTPNLITLSAILGSIATGATIAVFHRRPAVLLALPVWLLIRMALNAIDGMMARELRMATALGAALNEVGDVVSDLALYLPLAVMTEAARWPVIAFSIGAVMTEFCGLLGLTLGGGRRYEGPMGKSDRALMVGALGLAGALYPPTLALWPWLFALASALTLVTCWNRLARALSELKTAED